MNKFLTLLLKCSWWQIPIISVLLAATPQAIAEDKFSSQDLESKLQAVFAGKEVEIRSFDALLKEVIVGSEHMFVSHDGRYVFAGPIYDTHRQMDIVAEREDILRRELLNAQPKELFVRYPSTVKQKHEVTIVTDIDCPYCRKLHNSLGELNKLGVSVNYVMLPRAGVGSESYKKTLYALCSYNAALNITRMMAGQDSGRPSADCDPNQLNQQLELARRMKVRSTPTFVLPNGQLQVGLLGTDQLMRLLDNANVLSAN